MIRTIQKLMRTEGEVHDSSVQISLFLMINGSSRSKKRTVIDDYVTEEWEGNNDLWLCHD